jgi:glycerol-3-phosphate dehydrogenase
MRRTHLAFETRDHGVAAARRMASVMASRLDWSEFAVAEQLAAYERDVRRVFSIDLV